MDFFSVMFFEFGFIAVLNVAITLLYSCFMPFNKSKRYIVITVLAATVFNSTQYVLELIIDLEYGATAVVLNSLYLVVEIYLIQRLFAGRWYKKITTAAIFVAISALAEVIAGILIVHNLFNTDFTDMQQTAATKDYNQTAYISIIITISMILIIKAVRNKKGMYVSRNYSVLQIMIGLICIVCITVLTVQLVMTGSILPKDIILLSAFICLLIMFYAAFELSESIYRKNEEYKLQEQRHKLLEEYYQRVEMHQKEIRKIKHDMKNQLLAIGGYIKESRQEQAASQIDELVSRLEVGDKERFTRIPGLNALLNAKYHLAQREEIICEFTVKIPEDIKVAENDLSSVVGNILDNAIEACRYCSGQKYIQFKMVYFNHSLVLSCENSTDGQSNSIKTRKDDSKDHGIGIESIKHIVEKYEGNLNYQFDRHSFKLEITLFEANTTRNNAV